MPRSLNTTVMWSATSGPSLPLPANELWRADPRLVARMTIDTDESRWQVAVAQGAVGRYAEALATLEGVGSEGAMGSLALSTAASLRRQLGRHGEALLLDRQALAMAIGGEDSVDAAVGIAADHVGLGDLTAARQFLELVPEPRQWRGKVRRAWVAAEVALLGDSPGESVEHARQAVEWSRESRAVRHEAKSLLIYGVALVADRQVELGQRALRRSLALATDLGCWSLVWPTAQVLSGLVESQESRQLRSVSRAVVASIANELPAGWAQEWPAAV